MTEDEPTHFRDESREDWFTLCGQAWDTIVWSNDLRATCVPCQDVWAARTGWEFPLPETVALTGAG